MEITTLVTLLPLISQEVKLIGELNNFFNFDHNVFLLESSVDINNFMNSGSYPQSLFVFENSFGNITGLDGLQKISSKNTFIIVALQSTTFDENEQLLEHIKTIHRYDINMKIGIFFQQFTSMDDLRKLFQWCKSNQIVHVFAAAYPLYEALEVPNHQILLNIFTFHPFQTFKVMNVTNCVTYKEFFPSLNFNFHKQKLRLSHFGTIVDVRFWSEALRLMNASILLLKDVNYVEVREYSKYEIDVIPALRSLEEFVMYPMMMISNNIIVPETQPYSDFSSYLRTLTSDSFFEYSFGAIAAIVLSLSAFRYIEQKKICFFQSCVDVLNLLFNDNSYIKYQRLSRAEIFLIIPLTFVGFVIVNGILSNLQSYVTRPVLQSQIKTFEDLYKAPIPVTTNVRILERYTT